MVNILFLIDKLVPAGTQTNLLQIIKGLDRSKFNPKIIALVEGGELFDEFQAAGVEPIVLKVRKVYGPSGFKALSFLIKYMREEGIDIVQTHFLHADILGVIAGRLAGVPRIITARRDEGFWREKRQVMANRILNQYTDKVLANSEAVKEAVMKNEELTSRQVGVIHNGVDLERYFPSQELRKETRESLGIRDEEMVLSMIANMRHEVKGHKILIKALTFLHRYPQLKVLLIGDGHLRSVFERYALRQKVRDQILFLGSRRDINAIMNASDIICVPSLSEGFSNTILEAMAAAKTVVASNVGGNPEMIIDADSGFLVRPRHPEALAQGIAHVLDHPEFIAKVGESARKRVETHFSVEKMIRDYEAYYEQLMVKAPAPPKKKAVKVKRVKKFQHHGAIRPKRVMHIIWSLDLGGAEQVVVNLTRNFDRKRFLPVVCCLNEKGRYASLVENEGIPIFEMKKSPKLDLFLIPRLVKLIKRTEVDLIHTHLFTANLWGRIAGKLAKVPVISSEHGMDAWRNSFDLTLDQWLASFHNNKKIVCVSEGVRRFYSMRNAALDEKACIIHNGIDVEKFSVPSDRELTRRRLGLSPDAHVIGIVGRLVPEKAHDHFIEAVKVLAQKDPKIRALIIGEGKLLRQLKAKVSKLRLEDKIYFLGNRNDLPALYHAMDVFVMTSTREGFPLTILEAMAAGVPVVATNVGGIVECIEHEKDGILIEPNNIHQLVVAVELLLKDPEFRKELTDQATKKVNEQFSVQKMTRDHESLYEEILRS